MQPISPTQPSPAPAPGRTASSANAQGDGSLSSSGPDHNAITGLRSVVVVWLVAGAAGAALAMPAEWLFLHPDAAIFMVGLVGSAVNIVGSVLFAAHRGDEEMGIGDTQGRESERVSE